MVIRSVDVKSNFKEKMYLSSPIFIQNVLVSIYGVLEHRRRYGGRFANYSKNLLSKEENSREERLNEQKVSLGKVLENALKNVPHYQEKSIKDFKLEYFPILGRSEVFKNTDSFISNKFDKNTLLTLYTGGSTGNPLKVYLNSEIRQKTYAFWDIFYKRIGFEIGERKASFVGRKLQEPDNNTPPFWRYNFIDKQLLFSSYHLSKENLPLYIEKLNSFKPIIIEGYPMSIHRLAEYIIEGNVKLDFVPKGISTSSENISQKQRETIQSAFKCKVFDQYGSAESVVFAGECEFGNKHISMEYGVVEVLTKDGIIQNEGEGELIVTTLLNEVMPLIRYRIGDLGKVSWKECACGRYTPILEELYGKVGAVIVSEDKTIPTAAIAIAFEYLTNVKKSQLIQNKANEVIAKLAVTEEFQDEEKDYMVWELKKMLGESMNILVELVDDIPPGQNGKYQMVVQNYYK